MSRSTKQGTDVADQKVGAIHDSVNAAKEAKKELARQEREARKEAKRQEREAEKAMIEATKVKAKAEIDALKATNKEKQERLKREKEDAKLAAADQKLREEQALKSDVDAAAVEIHAGDENILSYDKLSTPDAERIGNLLIETKPKLKLLKPKLGFKVWIETICKILYRRANNYMRVAKAIAEDPSLREMGLTELYEHLRLVTRTRNQNAGGSVGGDDDDEGGEAAARKPDLLLGAVTARWFGGSYVVDLDHAAWQVDLHQAIDDPKFSAIINGRGLLIRLKDGCAAGGEAE